MSILFFLLCIIINFFIIFKSKLNWKIIFLPILMIFLFFTGAVLVAVFDITITDSFRNISLSFFLSLGFFFGMYIAKFLNILLLEFILSFHKRYNQENLHQPPISFLFEYKNQIINSFNILFFFGGIIMLYAIYFVM